MPNLALLGRHREVIAKILNIGVGYVEQVISNTPHLSAWRKKLQEKRKINDAAVELREARVLQPDWRRKDFKANYSQAFYYLYHHNHDLLETILPPKTQPHPMGKNWQKEDERLFQAIEQLNQPEQLSLSAIGREINDHGFLRKSLDMLPKTKALLKKLGKHPINSIGRRCVANIDNNSING